MYERSLPQETKNESYFPFLLTCRGSPFINGSVSNRVTNYLRNFMANLSGKTGLSKRYTNHTIVHTIIYDLYEQSRAAVA